MQANRRVQAPELHAMARGVLALTILAMVGGAGCVNLTRAPTDAVDVFDVAPADSGIPDTPDALTGTGLVGQRPY